MRYVTFFRNCFCITVLAIIAVSVSFADEKPSFSDRERLIRFLDNNPEAMVDALESVLSQEQIAALETVLFPPPSNEQKEAALKNIKSDLLRLGLSSDDTLVKAVDDTLSAVSAAVEVTP